MRKILLASAAVLALSPAIAETANHAPADTSNTTSSASRDNNQHLRGDLRNMLEKSGYTDIRMAPTSFMIHAKDTNGNPVTMSISPDSFTEVTAVNDATSRNGNANDRNDRTTTGSAAGNSSEQFVAVPNSDELSSKLVGLDVYNNSNQDIGQIKDIALNRDGRTQAYIVSVGGFLGIGEHYVAVSPSSVKVSTTGSDNKLHASMNATSDQLKQAPEFKYNKRT